MQGFGSNNYNDNRTVALELQNELRRLIVKDQLFKKTKTDNITATADIIENTRSADISKIDAGSFNINPVNKNKDIGNNIAHVVHTAFKSHI